MDLAISNCIDVVNSHSASHAVATQTAEKLDRRTVIDMCYAGIKTFNHSQHRLTILVNEKAHPK
jgi:hypothetical protein